MGKMSENGTPIELAEYVCHKRVRAGKIGEIFAPGRIMRAVPVLRMECGANEFVNYDWIEKHKPEVGGYFVRYADGYTSYSPAKAFEDGYTKLLSDDEWKAEMLKTVGKAVV